MSKYKKPIILIGNGARGQEDKIIAYAEENNIGIMTSWRAMDMIDHKHPLFKGRPGGISTDECMETLRACDFLLVLGCRLDLAMVGYDYEGFAPNAVKIIVDTENTELMKLRGGMSSLNLYWCTVKHLIEEKLDDMLR